MWVKKTDIQAFKYRINDLESRLCPCNSHDYVIINSYIDSDCLGGSVDTWTVRQLECSRCGKKTTDTNRFCFKYKAREYGGSNGTIQD